jgi:hypothetical protein
MNFFGFTIKFFGSNKLYVKLYKRIITKYIEFQYIYTLDLSLVLCLILLNKNFFFESSI